MIIKIITILFFAETCYRAGYIDSWGRGIEKITETCTNSGLPAPEIIERSGGVVVTLRKTPVKTPEAICSMLADNPKLTLAEISKLTDKSLSAVERAAKKLRDQGRIKYIGPKKGGYWEVLE
jgi:ATP-dependent DNA helicase RecG